MFRGTQAGFVINQTKPVLSPAQRILFLGYVIDTVEMKVFLPPGKVAFMHISTEISLVSPKIRMVAHGIGLIVSAFPAIFQAPLHHRSLERDKTSTLLQSQSYQATMIISQESRQELLCVWQMDTGTKYKCVELITVQFSLLTLVPELTNQNIQLQIDNKTAVAYINHMGELIQ